MMVTSTGIFERLQRIFQEVLEKDSLRITLGTTPMQVPEWDSLAQIALMAAIEKEFAVHFSAREAGGLVSVGAIVALIETKTMRS
ncbi:MAG: acyl carrier protein [Terracidiphilus sp.]|jgi:acyl carrier protein